MGCLGRSAPSKAPNPSPPPQMLFCWGFATIPQPPTALTPCFLPLRPLAFYGSFPPLPPCIRLAFYPLHSVRIRLALPPLHSARIRCKCPRILLAFGSHSACIRLALFCATLCPVAPPHPHGSASDPQTLTALRLTLTPSRLTLTALRLTPTPSRLCV